MAFVFNKNIDTNLIHNAGNNNIVEFTNDNPTAIASAKISVTFDSNNYIFEITPDIEFNFYFNFKEITNTIARQGNFADTLGNINLGLNPYDLYFLTSTTYTIYDSSGSVLDTATSDYRFYYSINQIGTTPINLNEFDSKIVGKNNLTIFEGYPFDFSIYRNTNIKITNPIKEKEYTFGYGENTQNRLFLSLGSGFIGSIEARGLSFSNGFSVCNPCVKRPMYDLINSGENIIYINDEEMRINVKESRKGIYLKWFEPTEGVFSYWLFEDVYTNEFNVKTKGAFNVDFKSLEETRATELITGKEANSFLKLKSKNLTNAEMEQVKGLFTSPRVELYLGNYGEVVNDYTYAWETVELMDATFPIKNTKRDFINLEVSIRRNLYSF